MIPEAVDSGNKVYGRTYSMRVCSLIEDTLVVADVSSSGAYVVFWVL